MNGALCNALTGQDTGRSVLEALERDNLFVVPLDDRRHWYRYHHLFADVLRGRLLDEQPGLVKELHRRAATWHEQEGDVAEAIRHSLLGRDFVRAAELVETVVPAFRRDRREATLRAGWRPCRGGAARAARCSATPWQAPGCPPGRSTGSSELLDATEEWLDSGEHPAASTPGVVDGEEYRRLPAELAVHRAGLALVRGDIERTVAHARAALDLVGEDDHVTRGAAFALGGLAAWSTGTWTPRTRPTPRASSSSSASTTSRTCWGAPSPWVTSRSSRGGCAQAARTYRSALDLADRHHRPCCAAGPTCTWAWRPDLEVDDSLRRVASCASRELGEHAGLPQDAYRWRVVMAGIREAEGDVEAAIDLLDEAERLYVGGLLPDVRPVPALRARTWARHGYVDAALDWVDQADLSLDDPLTYLREFEHVTLARVLRGRPRATGGSKDLGRRCCVPGPLLRAARRTPGRIGHRDQVTRALGSSSWVTRGGAASVERAGARRAGGIRPHLRRRGDAHGHPARGRRAADALGVRAAAVGARPAGRRDRAPADGATAALVEALSSREREVLRLLDTELNGPEIARELVVSLNTVRTHTKNLYMKLGVSSRRAAVRRARELDLL